MTTTVLYCVNTLYKKTGLLMDSLDWDDEIQRVAVACLSPVCLCLVLSCLSLVLLPRAFNSFITFQTRVRLLVLFGSRPAAGLSQPPPPYDDGYPQYPPPPYTAETLMQMQQQQQQQQQQQHYQQSPYVTTSSHYGPGLMMNQMSRTLQRTISGRPSQPPPAPPG